MSRFGEPPALVDVPVPEPGPRQVVLEVLAAGLCHTDLGLMALEPERFKWQLPFAPGHEIVGEVHARGAEVTTVALGDRVAVYGAWGCGSCRQCRRGAENYCAGPAGAGMLRPGLGGPGGVAEFVLIDHPRHLVPIDDLDPVAAVGLTDAGLTSHHAVAAERDRLGAGATTLVIGVGGLGHMVLQILRATCEATVVATDIAPEKRRLAAEVGAHHVLTGRVDPVAQLRALTGGERVDVVFDVVGSEATLDLARRVVAPGGSISIVGGGGGHLDFGPGILPYGVHASVPFWGTLGDLRAVLEMARRGEVTVHTQQYRLDRAVEAYRDLAEGRVRGRAVVVP